MNFWNIMMYKTVMMMTLLMDKCVVHWGYNVWDLFNCKLRKFNGFLRKKILLKYVCIWYALM